MNRTPALLITGAAIFCAVLAAPVHARKLRDIGGAIIYPAKKAIKNGGHNAKHIAGDPNRRRRKAHRSRRRSRPHTHPYRYRSH